MKAPLFILSMLFAIQNLIYARIPSLIPFSKDSLWGYCDQNLKVIVQPKYDKAHLFENGYGVVEKNKKQALIDRHGKEYFPFEYDGIRVLDNGLIFVRNDCSHGIIDFNGREVVPIKFNKLVYLKKHIVCAMDNGEISFYNSKLEVVRNIKADSAWFNPISFFLTGPYREFFRVTINKKTGLVRYDGKYIVEPVYDNINDPYRWIVVQSDNKFGVVNLNGKIILDAKYENVESFLSQNENRFEVKLDGKWGVVDSTGKVLLPFDYDYVMKKHIETKKHLYVLTKNGKGGLADPNGSILAPLQYDFSNCNGNSLELDGFFTQNKFLKVRLCGKRGILDSNYKQILPILYDEIGNFENGFCPVKRDKKSGYINIDGKEVIPCKYDRLGIIRNNLVEAYNGNKLIGYVGLDGKEYFIEDSN